MAVTPAENVAHLEAVRRTARQGAVAAATAAAQYVRDRARNDTLQRTAHGAGEFHRAKPGRPPARASGALIRDMFFKPASGGLRASALVGNKSDYGRIHEFGCVITPKAETHLGWKDTGRPDNPSGIWRHRSVEVPPHPFLGPTTDEAIDDGGLVEAMIKAFRDYDP